MRIVLPLFMCAVNIALAETPPVWSKTGHRTIGAVAEAHISKRTKMAIAAILNGQNLASVSNFADEIKADSTFSKFSAWHYVNFPSDKKYTEVEPSEDGDLVVGIQTCIRMINDKDSSKNDRAFYLKMLVHLIGDLHQPMHIGRLEDKGGNDIQVQWFNRGSNLHKVWDTNLIDDHGMSYSELATSLPQLSKKQKKAIQEGDVLTWVEEGQDMANEIYTSVETGEKLFYRYGYVWWPRVETQLQKGGLRLAKVLNDLFK